MPIYEYRCSACDNTFEHLHRRMSEPAPACPKCGAKKVEKLFSTFSAGKGSEGKMAEAPCAHGGRCAGASCPYA